MQKNPSKENESDICGQTAAFFIVQQIEKKRNGKIEKIRKDFSDGTDCGKI